MAIIAADRAKDSGGGGRKLLLVAAAALIDGHSRVLLAQRPAGKSLAGLWEFPGGKLEGQESPEAALVRELAEELGIVADAAALQPLAFASHAYADFHLLMPLFVLRAWRGQPHAQEGWKAAASTPIPCRRRICRSSPHCSANWRGITDRAQYPNKDNPPSFHGDNWGESAAPRPGAWA